MRSLSTLSKLLAAAVLVFGITQPASADLAAVGEVDAVTGFPFWYEDAVGLRLQLCDEGGEAPEQPPCLPELVNPALGFVAGNIGEALYYAAAAGFAGPNGESILAQCVLEAAGPELVGDTNTVGNVALLRIDDLAVAGDYTVVTPCGEFTFNVPNDVPVGDRFVGGVGATGAPGDVPPYSGALPGAVQIFANNGTGAPGFLGDGVTAGLLSSPLRPGGGTVVTVSVNGALLATGDLFTVVGKVSGCTDANLPPVAVNDLASTAAGAAVNINVLANDSDTVVVVDELGVETPQVISPPLGTVAIVAGSIAPPLSAQVTVNADNTITVTPAVGVTGTITFSYTVTDRCGLISNAATVGVLVEAFTFDKGEYRTRTGKWTLEGTSSFRDLTAAVGTETFYVTGLTSAQEVPPRTSAASGDFAAIFTTGVIDSFDYDLSMNVPPTVEITQAHIHVGNTGANGPIIFFLCTNLGNAPVGTIVPACTNVGGVISVSGTLTAAELQAAGGITTFDQAVAAIQSGGTYVNAHSVANPPGEIRGQIGRNVISLRSGATGPAIGAAEVQTDNSWVFTGKSSASPGVAPHLIHAESALGSIETRNLRLR